MNRKLKKVLILLGVELAVLFVIYLGFAFYFSSHFFYNTTLNGKDVSSKSAEKIKEEWEHDISAYSFIIMERDGSRDLIFGNEIDLMLQWDDSVSNLIKSQNPFGWIGAIFHKSELESDTIVDFDQAKLSSVIDALPCMAAEKQVMPVDATVSEFDKKDGFTLVKVVPGTAIDRDLFINNIKDSIEGLDPTYDIVEDGGYIQPVIDDDNPKLLAMIDDLNSRSKAVINYEVGDDRFTLDATVYDEWLVHDDNFKVHLDEEAVGNYVTEIARKYNTCYSARDFLTSYGTRVTIKDSHYGWKVDFDAEKAAIIETINNGSQETRDLYYSMTANSHTGNDYGNSYIEINLTAQHLFLYKEGKMILETDFVSGNVSKNNGTPAGAYSITYTQKDATLNGEDYSTPVSFWMPFNGNIGLHDATWRSKFGGTIYKTAGSHGCVNLPYSAAQTIFENVSKGYPVLLYEIPGSETVKSDSAEKKDDKKDDSKKSSKKKTSKKDKKSKKKSKKKTSDN